MEEPGAAVRGEDEGNLEPARKKRNMEKSASSESAPVVPDKDFTLTNILSAIEDVTNWKELGTQLGVPSARMNCIEEDEQSEEDRKRKMIQVWMNLEEASWMQLVSALLTPAMCENRVVKELVKRRGSSFDSKSIVWSQSVATSENLEGEFNEANVRNAIENVVNNRELGNRLGIPIGKLIEIDMLAPGRQKQKLVEILFKVEPDCNWTILRAAMKHVSMLEWTTETSKLRFSSLQKSCSGSFSEDFLTPDISSDASSMPDEYEPLPFKVVTVKNTAMIRKNYSRLIMRITKNLTRVAPDMNYFHQFVINLLEADIPKAESVKDIFDILSEKKYWKFTNVNYLESIAEMFSEEFEDQNIKMIKEYKEELAGFKIATKIVDYMRSDKEDKSDNSEEYTSIMAEAAKYDEKYRRKLAIKLDGSKGTLNVKISMKSLQYIEKLWDSLCDEFFMPSLPKLLDSIVAGSIVVTWLVRCVHARKILDGIACAVEFLRGEFIVGVFLEDVCIYDADSGVANVEVLNYTRLLMTEQGGDVDKMNSFLQLFFPNINVAISEEGRSLLMFAAQQGRKTMLEFLLDHGADPFQRDSVGFDVLSLSKPHSDVHSWMTTKLEEKLITAAQDGLKSNVEGALEFGVDPNAKEKDEYGWTALLWACENNHGEIVDTLLEGGADANAEDSSNWTGLILASRKGDAGTVKKLLDKGADQNKPTDAGWTALMWTAPGNHAGVAKLLLESGAKSTLHDKAGFSPLIQASQDGSLDVVKVLLEHDTDLDIDYTTETDWSALAVATKNGYEEIVRTLGDHGANLNYQKKDGVTSLHIASYKGHEKIGRYLCVEERVDVNIQDMDGFTPLIFASKQGQFNFVRLLVENGRAKLNISESSNKWTAVFFAMQADQQEVLEYLLRTGRVDLMHKDVEGNTLFDLSEKINKTAFEYLKKHHKADMEEHLVKKSREVTIAKPTTKLGKQVGEYYQPMLDRLQSRMKSEPHITAGAA